MKLSDMCKQMDAYDKHLARLWFEWQGHFRGDCSARQLADHLIADGQVPRGKGGWVPESRLGMLKMMKRAEKLAALLEKNPAVSAKLTPVNA